MKKILQILGFVLVLSSCNNKPIDKPDDLIDPDKMTNILYDLTLLDAIKTQSPNDSMVELIRPKAFIYEKYNVDSLQFVKSNQYYISQIEIYKKMYDSIEVRLKNQKEENALLLKKNGKGASSSSDNIGAPQVK